MKQYRSSFWPRKSRPPQHCEPTFGVNPFAKVPSSVVGHLTHTSHQKTFGIDISSLLDPIFWTAPGTDAHGPGPDNRLRSIALKKSADWVARFRHRFLILRKLSARDTTAELEEVCGHEAPSLSVVNN
jgi:hypothetical protein